MPSPLSSSTSTEIPYRKVPGLEPLPGYHLISPLGRGGFGEVWLCEAPGGLHKAVKFVAPDPDAGNDHSLRQEFEAFQTIKTIRHPFLLTLERVELVDGELVMIMELADCHLQDRMQQCQQSGFVGIPRPELLGYYIDAAEALDHIGRKYGLQHLDIKPANLFLLSGHVKVGDYGLVCRMSSEKTNPMVNRGLTPRYVAPEVLRGQVNARSDQYSLALVFQELLTNTFPYTARTAQQMMLAHVSGTPDLSGLPVGDRAVIGRAISKNPDERYPNCLAFVQALIMAELQTASAASSAAETLPPQPITQFAPNHHPAQPMSPPGGMPATDTLPPGWSPQPPALRTVQQTANLYQQGQQTLPASAAAPLPALTTPNRPSVFAPPPVESEFDLVLAPAAPQRAKLDMIRSVVPVSTLHGFDSPASTMWADQFIDTVLQAAAAGEFVPRTPGEIGQRPDGMWSCRFPTTMLPQVVKLKLDPMIDETWVDEVEQVDKQSFVMRKHAEAAGMWGRLSGKKNTGGFEILLKWPVGRGCLEVDVFGRIFGSPDPAFVREANEMLPQLLAELRTILRNVDDRRKTPRLLTNMPLSLYPIDDDGTVMATIPGRLRDISSGGLSCVTGALPQSRYVFAAFEGTAAGVGLAILVRLLRHQTVSYENLIAGRFRTDL